MAMVILFDEITYLAHLRLPYFPSQKEQKYIVELFKLIWFKGFKFHRCVTSDAWYCHESWCNHEEVIDKQTKLQLTYLRGSVLTLNKFTPGIRAHISLQEWQTTVTRGVYINSFSDSLHGRIGQKKITMLKLFDGIT